MSLLPRLLLFGTFSVVLVQAREAHAQHRSLFGLDAELGGMRSLDASNATLFNVGVGGSVHAEFNAHPLLGVHVGGTAGYFFEGQGPSSTAWVGGRAGLRLHWLAALHSAHDGWIDAHYDFGGSGGIVRSGFDVGLGFGFTLIRGFRIGPFARFQWASDPVGADPMWLQFGLSIAVLGDPREAPADRDEDGVMDRDDVCPTDPAGARPDPQRRGCPRLDRDGDGVADTEDACPTEPAGSSPDPTRRGCPAQDHDADGVPDALDACPTEPAGRTADPDRPGCPVRDADGDGVADAHDACPTVPAGAHPDPQRAGCPASDTDGDGVFDDEDQCVNESARLHPDPARRGCPLPDRDHDSVPDAQDHCPDQPGAPSQDPNRNGCPGLVRVEGEQIRIARPVFFATNREVILDASFPVLAAVADAIRTVNPPRVRVEGHSDNRGAPQRNLALSQRRAESVRNWLVEHGVPADRIIAIGYGQTHPIESNDSSLGRAANRRVEFHMADETTPSASPRP